MAAAHQPGLIDTNILIDALRNRPPAVAFLGQATTVGSPDISVITAMELVAGVRNGAELQSLQRALTGYQVHPVTPSCSRLALSLLETYTLQVRLGMADALIAATALELGLPCGGFVARKPFEAAQHKRTAVLLRQPREFFVQDRLRFAHGQFVERAVG